jgi:excisionase family DNA binding protein
MLEEQKQTLHRPLESSGPFLMTPEQCAQFLGIKINTLYVMKSQGRIPYRKVGHLLRFDFEEIVEWTKNKNEFGNENNSGTIPLNLCGCNRERR